MRNWDWSPLEVDAGVEKFAFYKVLENKNRKYLFSLIPTRRLFFSIRNIHNIPLPNTKHNFFKNSFFPSTIIELNNVDPLLRKSESFSVLKAIFLSSYDHFQTLFIIVINLEEFVLLEDLDVA